MASTNQPQPKQQATTTPTPQLALSQASTAARPRTRTSTSLPLPRVLPPPPTRHRQVSKRPSIPSIDQITQKTTVARQSPTVSEPVQPLGFSAQLPPFATPLDLPPTILALDFTDPLVDLDAFFNQMDAEITDMGVPAWTLDDLFVQDAFAEEQDQQIVEQTALFGSPVVVASPAPSTESEQSRALDYHEEQDMFKSFTTFDSEPAGIMQPELPAYEMPQADAVGLADPTMVNAFGAGFGNFGSFTSLNSDVNLLGLDSAYLAKLFTQVQPAAPVTPALTPSLEALLATTDWNASLTTVPVVMPTSIAPADLILPSMPPSPTLKRKESTSSDVPEQFEQPVKRPRGRPPKSRLSLGTTSPPMCVKRSVTIQSPASGSPTPLVRTVSLQGRATPPDADEPGKRSASGKPSTARPKSVVPEKYFKDGTAQAITGMTMEQILAFPTFDELLKQVAPDKQAGARDFGERIAENRDRAKDAAKKSRDEKRQKIEQLEDQVGGLEAQLQEMRGFLAVLLGSGRVSPVEVAALL